MISSQAFTMALAIFLSRSPASQFVMAAAFLMQARLLMISGCIYNPVI